MPTRSVGDVIRSKPRFICPAPLSRPNGGSLVAASSLVAQDRSAAFERHTRLTRALRIGSAGVSSCVRICTCARVSLSYALHTGCHAALSGKTCRAVHEP